MADNSTMDAMDALLALEEDIVAQYPPFKVETYFTLSAAVLVAYDYFLTLPLEITQIWHGRMNLMKALFLLNRYCSIIFLYALVLLYFVQPATDIVQLPAVINLLKCANHYLGVSFANLLFDLLEVIIIDPNFDFSCNAFFYLAQTSLALVTIASSGMFMLRTFAIYEKSWIILILLAIPALCNVASIIWMTNIQYLYALPPQLQLTSLTCNSDTADSIYAGMDWNSSHCYIAISHNDVGTLFGGVAPAVFDALVVVLTVIRTIRLVILTKQANANISKNLSYIVLRDGILYYAAIFIPELISIGLEAYYLQTGDNNVDFADDDISALVDAISAILLNRLALNLSYSGNTREDTEFRTKTGLASIEFSENPILGNIGAPLRTLIYDYDDEIYDPSEGDSNTVAASETKEMMIGDDLEHQGGNAYGARDFKATHGSEVIPESNAACIEEILVPPVV